MAEPPTKVFVAVHGIGDQVAYGTVQSVATRVAAYYNANPAVPLGRFYPATETQGSAFRPLPRLMQAPSDPAALVGLGFAEVYWAGIAREPETGGFVLEEAKSWAGTVSARIAQRAGQAGNTIPARERLRLATVFDQIIETIFILERLSYLPTRAGFFEFSLRRLLVDFVGDVQIVADFQAYRQRILTEFDLVMNQARALCPTSGKPELYIVAHSEGTVVAFLALLTALAEPDKHTWIQDVRGVMTIGSPIETHHLLWPELWQQTGSNHEGLLPDPRAPRGIPWHNYYDRGDPIAYSLADTSAWLGKQRFSNHLVLEETPFSRYLLPGKAHTDYWQDEEVFGHFFETVVKLPPPEAGATGSFAAPPGSKLAAVVASYAVPNALILALLLAATYCLYRSVTGILHPEGLPSWTVLRDVVGIGLLLLGITAAGRLPRLTQERRWWLFSAVMLAISMVMYSNVTCSASRRALGIAFINWKIVPPAVDGEPARWWQSAMTELGSCATDVKYDNEAVEAVAKSVGVMTPAQERQARLDRQTEVQRATVGVLVAAGLIALLAGTFASWSPRWGVRLLPSLGVVSAIGLILYRLWGSFDTEMWPLFLGAALFFYLWWLATLLFDLVFVWQRYTRHSGATVRISELSKLGYQPTILERAGDAIRKPAGATTRSTRPQGDPVDGKPAAPKDTPPA